MKALIIGGGGREHALAWAIGRSPQVDGLFVAPGNGGTSAIAENVPISVGDPDAILAFAHKKDVDLTVVGPEAPLVGGIVDRFRSEGRRCFGPTRDAARLEGSKVFAKEFMRRYDIPTADFEVFDDAGEARDHIRSRGLPVVIKADGLAAGKGVIVAKTIEEADAAIQTIMIDKKFGAAGDAVVVETCLDGPEVSVHAICGGGRAVLLPPSQDHKRIFDGDKGPNPGGMGAYAPVPFFTDDDLSDVFERVITRALSGMDREGTPFSGVLYAGLMMTDDGPQVLEFNVRFGDPETQVILPLVAGDVFELLAASADEAIPTRVNVHANRCAATVVMAAGGYPGAYEKGFVIDGLDAAVDERRVVFHAGTAVSESKLVTSGGRVLAVTAWDRLLACEIVHDF
ncbi:MAG: phosphoribosylamine--glycine ligase [bacterium]